MKENLSAKLALDDYAVAANQCKLLREQEAKQKKFCAPQNLQLSSVSMCHFAEILRKTIMSKNGVRVYVTSKFKFGMCEKSLNSIQKKVVFFHKFT